jgi:hypothetical protein
MKKQSELMGCEVRLIENGFSELNYSMPSLVSNYQFLLVRIEKDQPLKAKAATCRNSKGHDL